MCLSGRGGLHIHITAFQRFPSWWQCKGPIYRKSSTIAPKNYGRDGNVVREKSVIERRIFFKKLNKVWFHI